MGKKERKQKPPVITVELSFNYDAARKERAWFYEACHNVFVKWQKEFPRLGFRESASVMVKAEFQYEGKHIMTATHGGSVRYYHDSDHLLHSRECLEIYGEYKRGVCEAPGDGVESTLDLLLRMNLMEHFDRENTVQRTISGLALSSEEAELFRKELSGLEWAVLTGQIPASRLTQ